MSGEFHELARTSAREAATMLAALAVAPLDELVTASEWAVETLRDGGKILLFGNGGSAADAQHLAAELVGKFERERAGLAAIALTTDTSALTAIGNDFGIEHVFERQLTAIGRPGDLAVALSTSGDSRNVVVAVEAARSLAIRTVGFTGSAGGALAGVADLTLRAPSSRPARVQEAHIVLGHVLCELIEASLQP